MLLTHLQKMFRTFYSSVNETILKINLSKIIGILKLKTYNLLLLI